MNIKKIVENLVTNYKSIRYRSKIVNMNLNDLIRNNFGTATHIFRGFFGEPYIDNELLIASKVTDSVNIEKRLEDCSLCLYKFGWELHSTKTLKNDSYKVMIVPMVSIRQYMFNRSLGIEYKNSVYLYKQLGGKVY
jgi:hypothetical protein